MTLWRCNVYILYIYIYIAKTLCHSADTVALQHICILKTLCHCRDTVALQNICILKTLCHSRDTVALQHISILDTVSLSRNCGAATCTHSGYCVTLATLRRCNIHPFWTLCHSGDTVALQHTPILDTVSLSRNCGAATCTHSGHCVTLVTLWCCNIYPS